MTVAAAADQRPGARARMRGWVTNPWGRPRFLVLITWGYMLWAIVPVLIAVQYSFNDSRSRTIWAGFSTRWYMGRPRLGHQLAGPHPRPRAEPQAGAPSTC